jgi:2-phospho-L-lactate guanylyltransferase (CobY/MobA/RfbA family)
MIDREVKAEPDGAVAVPSGSDRADFIFLTKDQLGRRYPEVSLAGLPERGGAGLVLLTSDLAAAEKAVGRSAIRSGDAICVAPAAANGTLLVFIRA